MESHEEKSKRVGEAAQMLMEYAGNQYGMKCAQKLIRDLGYTIGDLHYTETEDKHGKWRLWTLVPPDPNMDKFIWAQPIDDIRGKIDVKRDE